MNEQSAKQETSEFDQTNGRTLERDVKTATSVTPHRILLSIAIPFVAFVLQNFFWVAIKPYSWFLFFPAVFFSSWIGGFRGGLLATLISTLLAWWFFITPTHSFALESPMALVSIIMFASMGVLFSLSHEALRNAKFRADEALLTARRANEELLDANEKITDLLAKTREVDELKTRFFANVSHELRTPLTLILGPAGNLLSNPSISREVRAQVEVVERNARLLYRHVSDLLDVAKLEAGRMIMSYDRVDLAALARVMASHFDVLAVEKKIRYSIEAPLSLIAEVDSEKFQRIMLNLLSNSFKFTPEGGEITASLHEKEGRAVLSIGDSGPGIPEEMRAKVFERFRQVEGGEQRKYGGTGLGLAIVKEFADLHGGSHDVAASPLGGALFTIALPLKAPSGAQVREEPVKLEPTLDRQVVDELSARPQTAVLNTGAVETDAPLVLVVEDNPDMNAYIAGVLGKRHRVASAFDGAEGLAKAMKTRPDVIISDVMMPGMSGRQMVAELRKHPDMADVPIVILTAKTDDALRVEMLRNGVQYFLTKPFLDDELLARVDGLVAKQRKTTAELRKLNAELEQRVLDRTAKLESANKDLESFSYSVSHDLRVPLRAIGGYSKILMEDYLEKLDEEGKEILNVIEESVQKMGQLIDDLLAFSRIGRTQMSLSEINMEKLAKLVFEDLKSAVGNRAVDFNVDGPPPLIGDQALIRQVYVNLISNAIKFTGSKEKARIEIGGQTDGDDFVYWVKDNGTGFDMRYRDKLFIVFQRLHSQEEYEGTGIGLAIVKRVIGRHQGRVWAEGKLNEGATFYFSIGRLKILAQQFTYRLERSSEVQYFSWPAIE